MKNDRISLAHIQPRSDYFKSLCNFRRLRENELREKEKKKKANRLKNKITKSKKWL